MPSGTITISAVPTRTPVPIAVVNRSCRWEREKERGKEPARKDLVESCEFLWQLVYRGMLAYAIVIIVLKTSSMKSPDHMLADEIIMI
jgi:hypothetical protein